MTRLSRLILEITNLQYRINSNAYEEYDKTFRTQLQRLEKELYSEIARLKENMTSTQIESFMRDITPLIVDSVFEVGKWEQETTTMRLEEVFNDTYDRTKEVINSGLREAPQYKLLHPYMVEEALNQKIKGEHFSSRIWNNKAKLGTRVYNSIYDAIRHGTDVRVLSRKLAKDFGVGTYEAMRLLQNETARVIAQAQDRVYQDSGIVEKVLYTATLDDRTTDLCQSLDGTEYDVNDRSKPIMPEDTHVGCRSCYVPIVDNWEPTIRHDNLIKENIEYQTYGEWDS